MSRSLPPVSSVLTLALSAVLLAGCVTQPAQRGRQWPPPESAPETQKAPPPDVGRVLPREPAPPAPAPGVPPVTDPAPGEPQPIPDNAIVVPPPPPSAPRSAEAISGSAVASLVRQARVQRQAGQPQQAQALLERAVRIEPRNYFVWSAMAQAYLDQKNYDQAENLAQKSNSLSRGNAYVQLENWKTIRAARAARGDASGAEHAAERVQAIEQALAGH